MEPTILTNLNSSPVEKKVNFKSAKIPQQFLMSSRSPSPTGSIITNGSGQQPKPNQVQLDDANEFKKNSKRKYFRLSPQVGTVVLYGVPIVSLYIESQERLCLAQISNTLLKQFSYNEIHNRRVALGMTCVQCTPVQLEILRRANAMPVSSRRCGMITRREAERLCKSFLGDNSPPRLPDDFAFSVHHECAWGCRGSFLPSRYNSSRAKCIKCSYCGLFFSPNKFIFHSHRISTSDKYIQPDAANFNSWRRHLKLSGTPLEKIMFAWEDVKAMFNGGTRKRIISSTGSESRDHHTSSSSSAAARRPSHLSTGPSATPAKKPKENSSAPPVASSSSSSTAMHSPQYHPMRPLNFATNTSSSTQLTSPAIMNPSAPLLHINPPPLRAPPSSAATPTPFPQEIPFSLSARSFMIDYMWHQQQQQQQHSSTSINAPTAANKASNNFQFAPYSALNWIKQPPQSFLFKSNGSEGKLSPSSNFNHFHSAFKPVINGIRLTSDEPSNGTSSIFNSNPTAQSPASSSSSNYNNQTANQSDDEPHLITLKGQAMKCKSSRQSKVKEVDYFIDVDDENRIECDNGDGECGDEENEGENGNIDTGNSSHISSSQHNEMTSDDENEMVDIETTEDDVQILNLQPFKHKLSDCENGNEEKLAERNNNYRENSKSPIKSLKEIVNRNESDNEDFFPAKRARLISAASYEWPQGLNLKKEVSCCCCINRN